MMVFFGIIFYLERNHMKKLAGLIFLLSACTAYAAADNPFQGFDLNVGVGGGIASFDVKSPLELTLPNAFQIITNNGTKISDSNIIGSIGARYTSPSCKNFVLAIAASATVDDLEGKKTFQIREVNSDLNITAINRVKLYNDLTVNLQPGLVLDDQTLVYALLGARWGYFKTSTQANYHQNLGGPIISATRPYTTNSRHKAGFTLGLGIRRLITPHISLGAEYAFTDYGKVDSAGSTTVPIAINGTNLGTLQETLPDIKTYTNTLLVTLSYLY